MYSRLTFIFVEEDFYEKKMLRATVANTKKFVKHYRKM